jgi:hypothetical protein
MTCPIRRCGGELVIEKIHVQDVTGMIAHTRRCNKNPRHRYFVIEGKEPTLRLHDDTRWKPRWQTAGVEHEARVGQQFLKKE